MFLDVEVVTKPDVEVIVDSHLMMGKLMIFILFRKMKMSITIRIWTRTRIRLLMRIMMRIMMCMRKKMMKLKMKK